MDLYNESVREAATPEQITSHLQNIVSDKDRDAFEWMEWVIMKNLPVNIVDDTLTRGISKLNPTSRQCLTNGMLNCHKHMNCDVEKAIKEKSVCQSLMDGLKTVNIVWELEFLT